MARDESDSLADLKVLDCTIRDGGYINRWKFSKNVVREVYRSSSNSGVDIFEIGFKSSEKFFDRNEFGLWRFSEEKDILEVSKGIDGADIGLMVDFGKVHQKDIPEKNKSVVSIIRVAAHKNKIPDALNLIEKIRDKGYTTSIQMMGYSTYSKTDQKKIVKYLENSCVDYAYIADSYGSILPFQMEKLTEPLLEIPGLKIGFHPHNSLQMAFANSLAAINAGVDIIDGSIFGMGRGAGNLPLETLIAYLQLQGVKRYNVIPVLHCVDKYFVDYHQKFKWGYQLPYLLSGLFGVHPYYSKTLVDRREYTIEDIWKSLELVNKLNPIGFSEKIIDDLIDYGLIGKKIMKQELKKEVKDQQKCNPLYVDRHVGKDFLVLANGPNLKNYQGKVKEFIRKYNPIVIGANYLADIFIPDYHAFVNKRRFIDYVQTVDKTSRLLLGQNISDEMINEYTNKKYEKICFIDIRHSDFDIVDNVIQTNCQTVSVLLMGVAIVMGAKRIFSAGLDGYLNGDSIEKTHFYKEKDVPKDHHIIVEKHQWCEHFLNQINNYLLDHGQEGIHILTPTGYKKFYKDIKNYL